MTKIASAGNRVAPGHRPGFAKQSKANTNVGKLLKAAREQRRLTLEFAAGEIKVPVKHLRALEEGDVSVFSAEVYARGAFAKYASYLDIEASQSDHAFMRVLSGAREFVPLRVHTPRAWLEAILNPRLVLASGLVAIALLLGSYVFWQVSSFFSLPSLTLSEPVSGVIANTAVTIKGQAAVDSSVAINEEVVPLSSDGSFELDLPLHNGINIIQVAATNAAGRTKTIQREILVPRN